MCLIGAPCRTCRARLKERASPVLVWGVCFVLCCACTRWSASWGLSGRGYIELGPRRGVCGIHVEDEATATGCARLCRGAVCCDSVRGCVQMD